MLIQTNITPTLQIYRDEHTKLLRYWEDATRKGKFFDVIIEEKLPRCITKDLTLREIALITRIFRDDLHSDKNIFLHNRTNRGFGLVG